MRKILFTILSFFCAYATIAQTNNDAEKILALQLVNANHDAIGLSADDLNNLKVSSTYQMPETGIRMVYLLQTYKGVPVYNQMQVLSFRNNKLLSKAGDRIISMEKLTLGRSEFPSVSANGAVLSALSDRSINPLSSPIVINTKDNGRFLEFNAMGVSRENITAELMWIPGEKNQPVKLAWQVYIVPKNSSDLWLIRVDAQDNSILGKSNLTVYDNWDKNNYFNPFPFYNNNTKQKEKQTVELIGLNPPKITSEIPLSPSLVNTVNYRVIKLPAEAPSFPGGAPAIVTNPWTLAPGNATSLGWHNDGVDYIITRGNNVWAKEDRAGNNSNAGLPATSTTSPDPLNFDFVPNFTVDPTQRTPVPNQQFNTTNLFYWNNIMHDVSYIYGFNEVTGNFQANNQGRGGLGNDWVYADAQDGSGTNNANFGTPPDGSNGRMQMFLWNAVPSFVVNAPAAIAGPYTAVEGAFSTSNLLANVGPVTGQVIYYNDDAGGTTHLACAAPTNTLTGKIAMIDRGTCTFVIKVKDAQNAGAIAVVMVNNAPGAPIIMGGADNTITIPAVMISQSDGAILAAQLGNNVNVTMSGGVAIDGDVDNGIIVHEYGHGISNRLTGGPANSSCLGNAEEMGEGISDYFSLMLTQNWATANLNTGFSTPRGIGTYVIGQGPTGPGIRNFPYCTNLAVNPLVYAANLPAEVHNLGEYWCATLWDMTWNVINQVGAINSSIYTTSNAGGNAVAMKLVIEGLRIQVCSPGFIDARNAILQADVNLFGGLYDCAIWEAFRRRGMGVNASQGSSNSVTDQVPDFTAPATNITTQPVSQTVCPGATVSFSIAVSGASPTTYQWYESINGGGTYNIINNAGIYSGATTNTITLTGVTVGMNNYRYRCIATQCSAATSNAAILTVTSSSTGGTVTPANTTVCNPPNSVTLTLTGAVGNILRWESSINNGGTWNPIINTTTTLTVNNVLVTTWYRAVVQSTGCAASNSTIAIVTFAVGGIPPLSIITDNGTTLCQGDPTLMTIVAAPVLSTFCNPATILVPGTGTSGPANPYPSVIAVSAMPVSGVTVSSVTLTGITHTWESDMGFVLVSPTNQKVVLMNSVSGSENGGFGILNRTYTFSDGAATGLNTGGPTNVNGTYKCTDNATGRNFPAPGPGTVGTVLNPLLATFTGNVNGNWNLYGYDFTGGDLGQVSGGYCITFSVPGGPLTGGTFSWAPPQGLNATNTNPVAASPNTTTTYTVTHNNGAGCIRTAQITITINLRPVVTAQPASVTNCSGTSASFTVAGTGTNLTYQWQLSINNGTTYTNLTNGAPYSGVNSAVLVVNPVTVAMNGYRYRCVLGGTCPPGIPPLNVSNGAILTVNPLPTVTVTPSSTCGGVAGTNGILLTASGGGANVTYTWSPAIGLFTDPGATTPYIAGTTTPTVYAAPFINTIYTATATNSLTSCTNTATAVVNYKPKPPTVVPASASVCQNGTPQQLTILAASPVTVCATASPNIVVPDNTANGVQSTINIASIPAGAVISNVSVVLNMSHTYPGDMIFNLKGPNGNILNLYKYNGGIFTGAASGPSTWGWYGAKISSTGTVAFSTVPAPYIYNATTNFKADALNTVVAGTAIQNPAGYVSNAATFADLISIANGNWVLAMCDGGLGDIGTLTSWQLCFTYTVGAPPPTNGLWSPALGLFTNLTGTPYILGTPAQTVYALPNTSTNYSVTVSTPVVPAIFTNATSGFTPGNGNYTICFNVVNNNPFSINLTSVAGQTFFSGAANVQAWYKASAISGPPGAYTNGNGWFQMGSTTAITGTTTLQPFVTGANLVTIPANSTYGIMVQAADGAGGFDLAYATLGAGVFTFSQGNVDIVTGTNIGYGGVAIPGAPTFTPRGFQGGITYSLNDPSLFSCTSDPRIVPITVNIPVTVTAPTPANAKVCTDKTTSFTVTAAGTSPTYQWQVSTDITGNAFVNIANGGTYSGVTTNTLTITAPPVAWDGLLYRCVVTGAAPCGSVISGNGRLTVYPLPIVVITASRLKLYPGLTSLITTSSAPAAAAYTWFRNGGAVATGTVVLGGSVPTYIVDVDKLGTYTITVTDVNGCTKSSNSVTVSDSVVDRLFIYPNPNGGIFQVRYNPTANNPYPRGVNVYNALGQAIARNKYPLGLPWANMPVDLRAFGSGFYTVEVVDVDGNRLAVGKVQVVR